MGMELTFSPTSRNTEAEGWSKCKSRKQMYELENIDRTEYFSPSKMELKSKLLWLNGNSPMNVARPLDIASIVANEWS